MLGFPALVDEGTSVRLAVFDTEEKAQQTHRNGLMRLFALQLSAQVNAIEKLPGMRDLAMQFMSLGTEKELKAQLVNQALTRTCLALPLPTDEATFSARVDAARGRILLVAQEILRLVNVIIVEYSALQKKLNGMQRGFPLSCADIAAQVAALMQKSFISETPFERLQHYPRYLKAAQLRLEKARSDETREKRLLSEWQSLGRPWERERNALRQAGQTGLLADPFLEEFRWLLEELRVALFAQELKTPSPVSVKRLQKMWEGRVR